MLTIFGDLIFNYDDNSFRIENPLIFMRDKFVFNKKNFFLGINKPSKR